MRVAPVQVANDQVVEEQGWKWSSRIDCLLLKFPHHSRQTSAARPLLYD